ncbi:MAG: hypothetical protein ACP5O0_05800, partial [Acidimicrobiales bacterium]
CDAAYGSSASKHMIDDVGSSRPIAPFDRRKRRRCLHWSWRAQNPSVIYVVGERATHGGTIDAPTIESP